MLVMLGTIFRYLFTDGDGAGNYGPSVDNTVYVHIRGMKECPKCGKRFFNSRDDLEYLECFRCGEVF